MCAVVGIESEPSHLATSLPLFKKYFAASLHRSLSGPGWAGIHNPCTLPFQRARGLQVCATAPVKFCILKKQGSTLVPFAYLKNFITVERLN